MRAVGAYCGRVFRLRGLLRGVSSRIVFFTVLVTLLTSLAVTWTSARSVEAFLRVKIDQKFLGLLRHTAERLDLWYSQRELDLATFAGSQILIGNAARLGVRGGPHAAARAELEDYLSFVLAQFPQYEGLFVLAADGSLRLRVGAEDEVSPTRRALLAATGAAAVSDPVRLGSRTVQFVSAPIVDARGASIGSVHAVLRPEESLSLLHSVELDPAGELYLVDAHGRRLFAPASGATDPVLDRLPEQPGEELPVAAYDRAGRRVIGSARRLERFGWTLVVEEPYGAAFAPVVAIIGRTLAINLGIVLLFGAVALQITTSIVRPIRALVRAARQVREGHADPEFPAGEGDDDLGLLVRTFREMVTRLHEVQAELRRQRDEIEQANARLADRNLELERANEVLNQLSITDGLTSLHNHRFFQDHLSHEVARAQRLEVPLSLILIDIDDFKRLNDRHGHAIGDAVLRRIAEVLADGIRDTDLLARYGGEEFVLLAPDTDREGARVLAEKLRLSVSETRFEGESGQTLHITVSIGVAAFRGDRAVLFNDADRALYLAKSSGKDCVRVTGDEGSGLLEGQRSRSSEA